MHQIPGGDETVYSLNQPARLIDPLEQCMRDRLEPGRTGWSSATHLGHDLERLFGVRAPVAAIERALRELGRHRRIQLLLDDAGTLWYRIRPEESSLNVRSPGDEGHDSGR